MRTIIYSASLLLAIMAQLAAATPGNAQSINNELQLGLSYTLSLGGVCEQLEMDEHQRYALDDLWLMTELNLKTEIGKFQNEFNDALPEVEKKRVQSEFKANVAKIRENESERINSVLDKKQIKRLKQIRFQFLRRKAGGMKGIKEELGLSKTQLSKLNGLKRNAATKLREMITESKKLGVPQADINHNLVQMRERFEDGLLEILTPGQKQKLATLEGEKYDFQYGPKRTDSKELDEKEATHE